VIASSLDSAQQRAVEAPFDDGLAIVGAPATGKTTALRARLERARTLGHATIESVRELAFEALGECGERLREIDDVEAQSVFEEAAAPLLAMERELVELQIDPEVPGLRSPQRFLEAAFRLQRKLTEALISPDVFLERALAGATEFYAKPPNFANPGLVTATKSEHRASLHVTLQELQRQYRREIDLAKLLAELYRAYERRMRERAHATQRDAVARAVTLLREQPATVARVRERHPLAFIDDVQRLTGGELALLRAVYGSDLRGVTLAGDANPEPRVCAIECAQSFRPRPRIDVLRAPTQRDEANAVAARVEELLADGAEPTQIAVLLRSVGAPAIYENALLDRNIPVQIGGDYNIFADRRALDALALLWNAHDPFRHEWLLRTLEGNAMALADASIAILCGEPADKQTVLFEEEKPAAPSEGARRDPGRHVRLARNVLEGGCDVTLSEIARERVQRFRAMREAWVEAERTLSFTAFVQRVWSDGLAREGAPGSARAAAQQRVLGELLARMEAFRETHPQTPLGDVLADAERRGGSDLETCGPPVGEGVRLLDVACASGSSFDHVIVANARPGAFPRWYAPDVFLFSPKSGMIPKDNVGDAATARTAKFTYYVHRVKAAEKYYARERRLFSYALSRARRSLLVTAFGRPTRGFTAPEFLEELR
jgi:superfamily I DNA/RNA helicase